VRATSAIAITRTLVWAHQLGAFPGVALCDLLLAAWANASAESQFNPGAVGDNGNSIGLFQCNMKGGLGRGHSRTQLMDPEYNTLVLAQEAARLWSTSPRTGAYRLTDWWCRELERPSDPDLRSAQRQAFLRQVPVPEVAGFTDCMAVLLRLETLPSAGGIEINGRR
jgi:hypothetical protein